MLKSFGATWLSFICVATVFATSYAPPDTRSWSEVTQNFTAGEISHANDGWRDGSRLKELDPKRAVEFLLPFLAKSHPRSLRLKAIGALGWSAFPEAIPALSAIAQDSSDDDVVRDQALNPGLRYMHHPSVVRTAAALAADPILQVRTAAYRVLGDDGSDEAIAVLQKRLRAPDAPGMYELILTFLTSKRPDAAKIVFENCAFGELPVNALRPYAMIMEQNHYEPAQKNMLKLLRRADRDAQFDALRYFGRFPREEVVPFLIAYIETELSGRNYGHYGTVMEFIQSPNISAASKATLSALVASGRVREWP